MKTPYTDALTTNIIKQLKEIKKKKSFFFVNLVILIWLCPFNFLVKGHNQIKITKKIFFLISFNIALLHSFA